MLYARELSNTKSENEALSQKSPESQWAGSRFIVETHLSQGIRTQRPPNRAQERPDSINLKKPKNTGERAGDKGLLQPEQAQEIPITGDNL